MARERQSKEPHRENVPGELDHISGEVEEVEASIIEGAGGEPDATTSDAELDREALSQTGDLDDSLLEDRVEFADLGLVVVDEQHRFGVEQRAALTDKAGSPPHVLVMTATPIPRTVAMTVFGDLETSVLSELPAGRAPIQTSVVPLADQPAWIERVWQRVREEVAAGHQVYVVCPRIRGDQLEQGEADQPELDAEGEEQPRPASRLAAAEDLLEELAAGPLSGLRLALLHGQLPPDEKDRTMRSFAAGDFTKTTRIVWPLFHVGGHRASS